MDTAATEIDRLDAIEAEPAKRLEVVRRLLGEAASRQLGLAPVPDDFLLSVVIPVYNERRWVRELVRRVQAVPVPKELILVDDFSTDGTRDILREIAEESDNVRLVLKDRNGGKGSALREGFKRATGTVVVVQDADLEYDPAEYPRLIQPIVDGKADVVFGSRFIGDCHRVLYFRHRIANLVLTLLSNWFTDLNLTDMETCYKVFRREVIQSLNLKSNSFGFEPEVTAKVARKKPDGSRQRVFEVPISYSGRTYEEGKKIGLKDAFIALWCIIRYRVAD